MAQTVIGSILEFLRGLPLIRRFALAGGTVMLMAMLVVGSWITLRI